MVRLHVFSIKTDTPSHTASSALLVSECHVSKHALNRRTELAPQPERATTAILPAPHVLLLLPGDFCQHAGEKRDDHNAV